MGRFGRSTLACVLLLVMGCGRSPEESTPAAAPSPSASEGAPSGSRLVTCGDDRPFPASVFQQPADAEEGSDAAAAELRRQIEHPLDPALTPKQGWRVLVREDRFIAFGAGEPPQIITLTLEREDGEWSWAGQGDCFVHAWRSRVAAAASWEVDPASPPSPTDTTLRLLVTERSCSSGADPTPRLEQPQIEYGEEAITISIFVREIELGPREAVTCIGNPAVPVQVELEEAVGDRRLLDGGVYPPATPNTAP